MADKSLDEERENLPSKEKLSKKFRSDAQRKYMYAAASRGEVSEDVVEEFSDKTPKGKDLPERVGKKKMKKSLLESIDRLTEIAKSLTAGTVNGLARRNQVEARYSDAVAAADAYKAGTAQEQPEVGTNREQDLQEPPNVPVRTATPEATVQKGELLDSCASCGYMAKSGAACPRCAQAHGMSEAVPYWRR
jgi:hypothetical protein